MTKKLKVGCDLFLDLRLYRLPEESLKDLHRRFTNIEIVPITVKNELPFPTDVEIYWGNRITQKIISALPDLKWIHFGSVGVNRAQTPEVVERKIIITNSKHNMTAAVATHAVSLMLALARGLHHCWQLQEAGNLTRESYDVYFDQTFEMEDQIVLIVGYGEIGKKVADICEAMGMKIEVIRQSAGPTLGDLKKMVKDSDYVVNLLPYTPQTDEVYTREIFENMKSSAFFINVGRGESVDESALVEAIKHKTIAGAGLDVFQIEPLSPAAELWELPEVIITPHIGGLTNRYWEKQTAIFAKNLSRYIEHKKLFNTVDIKRGY
jgi:phosphoglycerate dehydrogenase-like enzyme